MSESALERYRELAGPAVAERRSQPLAMWGMWLLIATEAALFACLIASYFYIRWETEGGWPPEGPDPKVLRPAFLDGALVLSALTMAVAQLAIRRGRQALLGWALAGTIALALAYLGLQIWDYAVKVQEGSVPTKSAYDSLNFLLTGTHAVHVLVGLAILGWIFVRVLRGAYSAERHLGISVVAVYWYFLAALAVAVFFTTIISPRL